MTRNKDLKNKILNYMFTDSNREYALTIYQDYDWNDILEVIGEIYSSSSHRDMILVSSFLKDTFIHNIIDLPEEITKLFFKKLIDSKIPAIVEDNLYCSNWHIRSEAIYIMGRILLKYEILLKAFDHFYQFYPIDIGHLIGEMTGIKKKKLEELFEKILQHKNYIFRWALIDINPSTEYLRILSEDENEFISKEAKSVLKSSEAEKEEVNFQEISDKHLHKMKNQWKSFQPAVSFSDVVVHFSIHLDKTNKNDYSIEEFNKFLTSNFTPDGKIDK